MPCALLYCFGSLSYCVFPNLFQLAVFQYCPYTNYQTYVRLSALLFCFGGLCVSLLSYIRARKYFRYNAVFPAINELRFASNSELSPTYCK